MLIQALTTLFAIIALYIGYFLVTHTKKPFLIFDPRQNRGFQRAIAIWGVEMLVVGVLALVAAFVNSIGFTVVVLMIGCFSGPLFSYNFVWYTTHKR